MPRRVVISVVGPNTNDKALPLAEELGKAIAQEGYVLLTGGRSLGVMHAAAKGAQVGVSRHDY